MSSIKELRAKSMALEPKIRIGKNGITDAIVREIRVHLKKHKMVKVKFLQGALTNQTKKELVDELIVKTHTVLVHKVGFIAVIARKNS
jgi:RNA-binding protein